MTDASKGGSTLIDRARNILLKPNEEWPRIEAEPATIREILVRYVLPLAAISPVASFIGSQVFGYGALGFTYRPGVLNSLSTAIVTYVFMVIGVLLLSLVADFLAPKFGGRSDKVGAFKLVAYAGTAGFLAGIFGLIPSLAFLGILGLYGVYLLYTGATPLMKVPQDKAIAYTAVTIVCALVMVFVVGAIARGVVGTFVPGPTYVSDTGTIGGRATIPGVGTINLDKAQQAVSEMEAASKRPAADPAELQALLPAQVSGYQRIAVESAGLGGMGSEASGTYEVGGKSFRLKIADMAAVGALAGLGSAIGVSQSREDADGYERTATVNGRIQNESWNRSTGSGKFGVVIANRFMVEADGSAASIDELKAAVASVSEDALAELGD